MTLAAFHSDAGLRTALSTRLLGHANAGRLVTGPLAWDGAHGSLVGCMLESSDLAQWEQVTGLPAWLATLIDATGAALPTADEAVRFVESVLATMVPGANLSGRGGAVITQLLGAVLALTAGQQLPAPLQEVLVAIATLHQRSGDGAAVEPGEWRAARRAATLVTDSLGDDAMTALARCVETAAWDPRRSHAVVADTMHAWCQAYSQHSERCYGWGDADNAAMQKRLDGIAAEHFKDGDNSARSVFDFLEELYPAEAARLAGYYKIQRSAFGLGAQQAAARILSCLS